MPIQRQKLTQELKDIVISIIREVDKFIPVHYVQDVQSILRAKKYHVSDQRVKDVRVGRAYDFEVAMAIKQVAITCKNELEQNGTKSTAYSLGLAK